MDGSMVCGDKLVATGASPVVALPSRADDADDTWYANF